MRLLVLINPEKMYTFCLFNIQKNISDNTAVSQTGLLWSLYKRVIISEVVNSYPCTEIHIVAY